MEPVLLVPGRLAGGGEEAQQQLAEMIGAHAVEVMLAFPARLDQAGNPQERQMMAHRRLALSQPMAEIGDVKLVVLRKSQVEQDAESGLVAEQLEDLGKLTDRLLGDFGEKVGRLAVAS